MAEARESVMCEGIEAPGTYRQLLEPRPVDVLQASVTEFWREFYDLRVKHGFADVHVIIKTNVLYDD